MGIDESGHDDHPGGIDHLSARQTELLGADGADTPIVIDTKVTLDWTGRREDGSVGNDGHAAES
jgi:hypothetical protein